MTVQAGSRRPYRWGKLAFVSPDELAVNFAQLASAVMWSALPAMHGVLRLSAENSVHTSRSGKLHPHKCNTPQILS